jgi:hypothetical protein
MIYRRAPGGDPQGIVSTWTPQSFRTTVPFQVQYEAAGANGLKVTDSNGVSYTATLGGAPAPVSGGTVVSGMMAKARQIDDRTIEIVRTRQDAPVTRDVHAISVDGKTLTLTSTPLGPNAGGAPEVEVFVKQR